MVNQLMEVDIAELQGSIVVDDCGTTSASGLEIVRISFMFYPQSDGRP